MRYIFLLSFVTALLYSNILVSSKNKEINLLKQALIYYDKDKTETINTLLHQSKKFKQINKEYINLGDKEPFPVWIKFTLNNQSLDSIKRIINIDNPLLETIELYSIEENKVSNIQYAGSLYRKNFHGIFMFHFPIEIKANTKQTYFLKIYTQNYPFYFKLKLSSQEAFIYDSIQKHALWALFIGILFTVMLYNLFLFISTKDKIYFYYLLYLFSILLGKEFSYYLMIYLLPMNNPSFVLFESSLVVYYANFTIFSMSLFIQTFLNTQLYPKLNYILKVFIILPIIHSIIVSFNSEILQFQDISYIYILILFVYFFIGLYALYKKNPNGLYFVIGWGLGLLGWISSLLHELNILNTKYYFYYIYESLIVSEIILFSFAIASRIKRLKNEKHKLTQSLLKQKRSENVRLEKLVEQKTDSLNLELQNNKLLLKELHHRIKNNMQFISSLYSLKLNTGNNNEELNLKLQDIESKIYAMNQVHELLYNQENVSNIETENYFEKIINQITTLYNTNNIYFSFHIKTKLNIEEAIYCGLIVNELVTNSIKYAFENMSSGKIHISLEEKDAFKDLTISDNGRGIDKDNIHYGFGKTMVETLATLQLNGKININTQDGTTTQIIFPKQNYNDSHL